MIGGLLYLIGDIFNELLRLGYVPYGGALQIMGIPYVAVAGVICGVIVGLIIWSLAEKFGFELPAVIRATIGVLVIVFVSTLFYLVWGDPNIQLNTPPLINQFFGVTLRVLCFGALPGIAASPARPSRNAEEISEFKLRNLRKLEAASGLMTFGVAGCLSAVVYRLNWETLPKPEIDFRSDQELLLVAFFFLLPASLVSIGSYAHARRGRSWGQVVLAVGFVFVLASSICFVIFRPFDRIYLWSWHSICLALLATMAFVFSLKAGEYLKQRTDSVAAN